MPEVYTFSKSFEITTHGGGFEIKQIEIPAPSGIMQSLYARLEGQFNLLQKDLQKNATEMIANLSEDLVQKSMELAQSNKQIETTEEKSIEEKVKNFQSEITQAGFDCSIF